MKKYLLLTFLIVLFIIPIKISALGSISISTTNLNIVKGNSATFTTTANNSAGKVTIFTSNSNVASISESSLFLDMQSGTITVTGISTGVSTITVTATDVTTYDDEDISGTSYTINVNVYEPQINNDTNIQTNTLSENNNLKEISTESHDLEKVDTNNILKEDAYYLEDLKKLLKDNTIKIKNIKLKSESKVSKNDVLDIKKSGKVVSLNYYNENQKLIYSWILDGSKIKNTKEFLTSIEYVSKYTNEISKLTNYADGLYIKFNHSGNLPEGTKVKIYVEDKYKDKSLLNIYYYNKTKNKLEIIEKSISVKDGYVEFSLEHCSEYFVTKSNVEIKKRTDNNGVYILLIISIIEFVAIVTIALLYVLKVNKLFKKRIK